ncbi:hypothetical protein DU508_02870 [Pedobacter chinensis]|uniref:Uncharacterized protein n=1 Tax=Pedobacter chinensis TaxID=2282421 RepID=A0A369Q092_9SPHI|nr:hypothetical protein DU508_02870 [Pedobacter chinensis]
MPLETSQVEATDLRSLVGWRKENFVSLIISIIVNCEEERRSNLFCYVPHYKKIASFQFTVLSSIRNKVVLKLAKFCQTMPPEPSQVEATDLRSLVGWSARKTS